MKKYIGIDIGGTNLAAGIVSERGDLLVRTETPMAAVQTITDVVGHINLAIQRMLNESELHMSDIDSIGVGVPGTANKDTGILEFANNLDMDGESFVQVLTEAFHKKIHFDNDANAAAWGEHLAGAGKGRVSSVMVTLGTGVGGGMILNNSIYRGINFAAGELGHMVIETDGVPCSCGLKGCFESYCSATALVRMTKEAMENEKGSLLWELSKGKLSFVSGKILFDGVRAGDLTAERVFSNYMKYLSVGITNIINILQTEILILGGGISNSGDLILPILKKNVSRMVYTRDSERQTELATATLYNDAGIIGAALLPD